jgi:hypothetical protein
MITETSTVPLSSPPSAIGFIVLELSTQHAGDQHLEQGSLDGNCGNHAQHSVRDIPQLDEPQELEEPDETDNAQDVSNGGHG